MHFLADVMNPSWRVSADAGQSCRAPCRQDTKSDMLPGYTKSVLKSAARQVELWCCVKFHKKVAYIIHSQVLAWVQHHADNLLQQSL